jgi:hypothetical protein
VGKEGVNRSFLGGGYPPDSPGSLRSGPRMIVAIGLA